MDAIPYAIKSNDPVVSFVSSTARRYGVGVVFPYIESDGQGRFYDSLDVFDETGARLLHYQKARWLALLICVWPGCAVTGGPSHTDSPIVRTLQVNLAAGESQFFTAGEIIGPVVTFKSIKVGSCSSSRVVAQLRSVHTVS